MLLQLICLWGGGTANITLHVNKDNGTDNSTCRDGSVPCATLAYALEDLDSDTTVLLDNEVTSHFNITTVQGPISNITLSSSRGKSVINCSEEAGLAFINVSSLAISNVKLHNCGAWRDSTSYNALGDPVTYSVALYLYNCTDVSLVSTTVSYSPGAGVVMLAVIGLVEVSDSNFIDNGHRIPRGGYEFNRTFETVRLAGCGLLIELPSCPLGVSSKNCTNRDYDCNEFDSQPSLLPQYSDVSYVITNSRFINNTAETPDFDTPSFLRNPQVTHFTAIGRGGGLSVFIKGRSENIHVAVSDSIFDNNWALYGGGLFMELWHHPINVSLEVINTNFTRNELPYNSVTNTGTGGGGLRYIEAYCSGSRTTLLLKGCRFDDNKAFWGGGSSISIQSDNDTAEDRTVLTNCNYTRNIACIGAAVDVTNYVGRPTVVLEDMAFIENSNKYADSAGYISGEGMVYLWLVRVVVKSSLSFERNEGSGISSFASTIHFCNDSTSLFYNNHAFRGAALSLYGSSAMILYNRSQLNFTENKADTVGGAIYHTIPGNRGLFDNGACPIRMAPGLNWSHTDLWFINNTAAQGGRGMSIYTYSIYPCARRGEIELNETLYFSSFNYSCDEREYPDCMARQVSGDGSIIDPSNNLFLRAFPGELAPLPFNVSDGQSKTVRVPFEGIVTGNDSNSGYSVSVLNGSIVVVTGVPSNGKSLNLHSTESQTLQVQIELEITECPPGYLLSEAMEDDRKVCQCAVNSSKSGLSCDSDANQFRTAVKPNYWVGYTDDGTDFKSAQCPFGFCRAQQLILMGSDHYNLTTLDEKVCGPQRRTGILCGMCKDGYGISFFHSKKFQCVPCNDTSPGRSLKLITIWFFTEFVPLNVLFIVFIVFNVNILSGWGGTLYTYVFFCQIVTKSPVFQYVNTDQSWSDPYEFFLSVNEFLADIWNLEFFSYFIPADSSCYSTESLVRETITRSYFILLLWPLLLYILLVAFHKCYHDGRCCTPVHNCLFSIGKTLAKCRHSEGETSDKREKSDKGEKSEEDRKGVSSLAGLCSFFVLAYTRLVILTWEIFVKATVFSSDGEERGVFFYDGTVPWFDPTLHVPYVLPILLCSFVTVLIPTLLLVSFPLVPKLLEKLDLHERRPFSRIITFLNKPYPKNLLDIFQGCFKDNARLFAALYLLYRHLFLMIWALADYQSASFWQLIWCVLFALIHSIVQPFKSSMVNMLSSCLFALLILVIFIGDGNFYTSQFGSVEYWRNFTRATTIILLFIPHVVIAGLFIWWVVCLVRKRYEKKETSNKEVSKVAIELEMCSSGSGSEREVGIFFDREPRRRNTLPKEEEEESSFTVADLTLTSTLLTKP